MDTKTLLRAAVGAACAVTLVAGVAPAAHADVITCRYQLGFAELARLLGTKAGTCREDQHSAFNGNAEQQTTTGLMVWRKADNWTAFTDGYRTWINGPNGLEERLNGQRFAWEPDFGAFGTSAIGPVPPAPPPPPGPQPSVPGTGLGLPVAGPTLQMTALSVERLPGLSRGTRLLKVTVKVEPGTRSVGAYASWDFRLRSPGGVEYRPSSYAAAGRPGALGDGTLMRGQFVVGDLYFEVPEAVEGYGLHYYPQGTTSATLAISTWLGATA